MQGSFSEAALEQFAQLAAQTQPEDFAESDAYDFTRCVRANGSAYGTRGECRKGTESTKEPKERIIGNATPAQRAAMENKAHQMRNRNAQADRAALARKVAKEIGKDVRTVEVAKEVQRRQEEMAAKRNAAIERISKERGVSSREAGSEADKIRMKELDNDIKSFQSMADKARENGFRDRAVDYSKKISELIQERADLRTKLEKGETKANRAGSTAKKATSVELKAAWKDAQGAVKSAATEAKRVASETKGDKSPEARAKRLAAGAALEKAENAAFKASEKFFALSKRESRAAMTPEQRKLEREADKLTKGG